MSGKPRTPLDCASPRCTVCLSVCLTLSPLSIDADDLVHDLRLGTAGLLGFAQLDTGTRGASTAGSEAALVAPRVPLARAFLCRVRLCVSYHADISALVLAKQDQRCTHRAEPRESAPLSLASRQLARWTARGGSYEWAWRSERADGRGSDEHSSRTTRCAEQACGMRENQQARHPSKPQC